MKINAPINRALTNAAYIFLGNFTSQVIAFLGMIFISNELGPLTYGVYILVLNYVSFFQIFSLGGMNKAIIRKGSKDLSQYTSILGSTVKIRIYFSFLAIFLCIISLWFVDYEQVIKWYILFFTFQILLESVSGHINTTYQAFEKMQYVAVVDIVYRIFLTITNILVVINGFGVDILLMNTLIITFIALLFRVYLSKRMLSVPFIVSKETDWKMFGPGLSFSFLALFNKLSLRIDLLFISFLGSIEEVAIYAIAMKFCNYFNYLRNVIAMAFFPTTVKHFNNNRKNVSNKLLFKFSIYLGSIMLIISLVISKYSNQIINSLFSDDYYFSGEILSLLIFYVFLNWLTLPFTTVAQANKMENHLLYIYIFMAVINIILNIVFYYEYGLIGIAYSTLFVFGFGCVITIYFVSKSLRNVHGKKTLHIDNKSL